MNPIVEMSRVSLVIFVMAVLVVGCTTTPEPVEETAPAPEQEEGVEESADDEYTLGDQGPAGGHIFYVDEDNAYDWTYLEAAPSGWHGEDADPRVAWGEVGVEVGADGVDVGTGQSNTEAALGHSDEYAAALAAQAVVNGFDDWFLPSEAEMYLIYVNLVRQGEGGLAEESYWSSTERNPDRAMVIGIGTGGKISGMKDNEYRIRPIRAF